MTNFKEALERAKALAAERHASQKYGEGQPYTEHLRSVEAVLGRFGYNPDHDDQEQRERAQALYVAAWLHDIIEDTSTTVAEIEDTFGLRVSRLVFAVTNEPGKNRAERHEKTYPKILFCPDAIILKLADRIANVEASIRSYRSKTEKSGMLMMYSKEWDKFKEHLYEPGKADDMWMHLEKLFSDPQFAMEVAFPKTH